MDSPPRDGQGPPPPLPAPRSQPRQARMAIPAGLFSSNGGLEASPRGSGATSPAAAYSPVSSPRASIARNGSSPLPQARGKASPTAGVVESDAKSAMRHSASGREPDAAAEPIAIVKSPRQSSFGIPLSEARYASKGVRTSVPRLLASSSPSLSTSATSPMVSPRLTQLIMSPRTAGRAQSPVTSPRFKPNASPRGASSPSLPHSRSPNQSPSQSPRAHDHHALATSPPENAAADASWYYSVKRTDADSAFPGFRISTLKKKPRARAALDPLAPTSSPAIVEVGGDGCGADEGGEALVPPPLPSEDTLLDVLSPEAARRIADAEVTDAERLDLGGLKLGFVPSAIGGLSRLYALSLAANQLSLHTPIDMGAWTELQELDMSFNPLLEPVLSSEKRSAVTLTFPASLTNLSLRDCSLASLSTRLVNQLPFLCGLDVRYNGLTELPSALLRHPYICELLASHNTIDELHVTCKSRLRGVDVSHNRLRAMSFTTSEVYSVERLLVAHNRLVALPGGVDAFRHLTVLDVSFNGLSELPASLGALRALTTLRAQGNRISKVDVSFGDLVSLRLLNLAYNCLTAVPSSLSLALNLRTLNLSCNHEISTLVAVDWAALPLLSAVLLSGAKLQAVPPSLGSHPSLSVLSLGYNRITTMPSFADAARLTILSVPGNRISLLCDDFVSPTSNVCLRQLSLRGNSPAIEGLIPAFGNHVDVDVRSPEALHSSETTSVGAAETIGLRKTMENRLVVARDVLPGTHVYGLFDGHGGVEAADLCAAQLVDVLEPSLGDPERILDALRDVFLHLDRQCSELASGACAAVAVQCGSEVFVANCGNARVLLLDGPSARCLTTLHDVCNGEEVSRIASGGGSILHFRLDGVLEATRSIGDSRFPLCIAEPFLKRVRVDHAEDALLVLGCRGLFEELPAATVAGLAQRYRTSPQQCARFLRDEAFFAGSSDNASCIVARFV